MIPVLAGPDDRIARRTGGGAAVRGRTKGRPIVVPDPETARERLAKAVAEHEAALAAAREAITFHEAAIVALKRAADRLVAEGAER
jgi:hypothetical protein